MFSGNRCSLLEEPLFWDGLLFSSFELVLHIGIYKMIKLTTHGINNLLMCFELDRLMSFLEMDEYAIVMTMVGMMRTMVSMYSWKPRHWSWKHTSCFNITPPRLPYRAKCPATDFSVLKLSYFLWKDSMDWQYHTLPLHTSIPKYHTFMSTHTHFAVASVASLHHFINVWKQIKCIGTNGSVLNLSEWCMWLTSSTS